MDTFFFFVALTVLLASYVNTQSVVHDARLDNKELRCLVCKASIEELKKVISNADHTETVKIGGHRLDAKGNYETPKTVPITKSEVYLSEQVERICDKMDDYVRALWKSNGTLTLLKMVEDGKMSSHMGDVDFVQDDDLNKSLKYYVVARHKKQVRPGLTYKNYNIDTVRIAERSLGRRQDCHTAKCEGVMEEYEENIIKHFQVEDPNVTENVCTLESKLCLNIGPQMPEKEL